MLWPRFRPSFGPAICSSPDRATLRNQPWRFTCIQFLVVAGLALPLALLVENNSLAALWAARASVLYGGLLSTAVAFGLVAVALKHTLPTDAAVIMALEAVFAAGAGYLWLGERLGAVQWLGAALVLAGVLLVNGGPRKKPRPRPQARIQKARDDRAPFRFRQTLSHAVLTAGRPGRAALRAAMRASAEALAGAGLARAWALRMLALRAAAIAKRFRRGGFLRPPAMARTARRARFAGIVLAGQFAPVGRGNFLARQLFDGAQIGALAIVAQRDRDAFAPRARGVADCARSFPALLVVRN